MALRASVSVQKDARGLNSVLASAVLEWFLIVMLFVIALLSYLVTKFAHAFELQTPCLFCSRLDHILGNEKPGFYRDLLCRAHKLEISTLVYCLIHDKLADVQGMCDGCMSLVATDKKFDHGACKSSMGKLEPFIEYCVDTDHNIHLKSPPVIDANDLQIRCDQDIMLNGSSLNHSTIVSSSIGICSCCNEPCRKFDHRMLETKSIIGGSTSPNASIPSIGEQGRLHHQYCLKLKREKVLGSKMQSCLGQQGFDPMTYMGYTELKLASDSESEIQISDDEYRGGLDQGDLKEEFMQLRPATISEHVSTMLSDFSAFSFPIEKLQVHELPGDMLSVSASFLVGNSLKEINSLDEMSENPPPVFKPTSSDGILTRDAVKALLVGENKETFDVMGLGDKVGTDHMENAEILKDSVSTNSVSRATQTVSDLGSAACHLNDSSTQTVGFLGLSACDLNDSSRPAVGTKGNQPSTNFTELLSGKDTSIEDDLKLLLSQMASVRGFELSWTDSNPAVQGVSDDSKISGTSSTIGLQILPKRLLIERNESNLSFESLDESLVSEIEGESIIDRLKRQIEVDWKSMNDLYKELDEERSASAIAANQAMAMINRLQEEKAAMQMEALQYQRMMEEQVEYDQEAQQNSNDLLAEREKEIQDLEEELEFYRNMPPNELEVQKTSVLKSNSNGTEMRAACHENNSVHKENKIGTPSKSLFCIEDEKSYILTRLKKLENMFQFSNGGVTIDSPGSDSETEGFSDGSCVDITHHAAGAEDGHSSFAHDATRNGGSPCIEVSSAEASTENNLVHVQKQISQLNERLRTLEEDRFFLEQTVSSLRNGNEGLQFVQEIASHLEELRKIGMKSREQTVACACCAIQTTGNKTSAAVQHS